MNTNSDRLPNSLARSNAGPAINEDIVAQAVGWYVRLSSGQQTSHDEHAFQRWLAAHAEHERAWQRMQDVGGQVRTATQHIGSPVARTTLLAAEAGPPRRRALKALVWIGAGGTALYLAQRHIDLGNDISTFLADARTAAGERRTLTLADGTRLMLNTATSVDIRFDAHVRRVLLRSGEIMIATAADFAGRPFIVETPEGSLRPVGTRFTVRRDDTLRYQEQHTTRLGVSEGEVDVYAASVHQSVPVRIAAGQQTDFTKLRVGAVETLRNHDQAWADGVLIAERAPLGEFIAELDRYRPGRLRCASEIAHLRITGTWPLDDTDPTDRILNSLERQLPVRAERLTRYWVTLRPR